jgi:hypothetical protein
VADFLFCTNCQSDAMMQLPMNAPDGGVVYTCLDDHRGTGPWVFTVYPTPVPEKKTAAKRTAAKAEAPKTVGAGATNDLIDPLTACFEPGGPWLEYGVVEAKLRENAPAVFARHVREAGHTMFGTTSGTASGRVATALGALRARGFIEGFVAPSTGAAWGGKVISHWCMDKRTPRGRILTWADYRAGLGLSDDWTDADREGLAPVGRNVTA